MKPGKPSNTALIVAAGLQLARRSDAIAPALPHEAIRRGAALLAAASPRIAACLRHGWFRAACRALERATLSGICLHFALRKRALREHARAALAQGCTQVVVLGAGFDTLCMELQAAAPALCCIEIDHPATQGVKRRAAGEGGRGVHYIGADLARQSLAGLLSACPAFRADAQTLFVAEGLLMYVRLDDVAALFAQMAAAAPRSRVTFTWLEPQSDGRPNFRRPSKLVDGWLKLRGEPFLSGLRRADLRRFLATTGFALEHVGDSIDVLGQVQRGVLAPNALPIAGEYLCLARTRHL